MSDNSTESCPTISKRARPENASKLIIGTHSGTFHCDEVFACFMLRQLPQYNHAQILRTRNYESLKRDCHIVVDVGGLFEPKNNYFDHHQKGFHETFSTQRPEFGDEFRIKLSSAGLVYAFYGEKVIENILLKQRQIKLSEENLRLIYVQIYRNFVSEIDAIDNGMPMYEGEVGKAVYKISTHISARVAKFNAAWDAVLDEGTTVEADEMARFEKAMDAVGAEFTDNVIRMGESWVNAREFVRVALEEAKSIHPSGEILVLPRFCPWKSHLADLEKEYGVEGVPKLVIFCENPTSWRVAGVPVSPDSFLGRQFLPVTWRGLRDNDLKQVSGLDDLIFVHHTGFIGGATTKAAALAMAKKSIERSMDTNELEI